jgi:cysteine desulfurase family protein (TIGR01976 family)
MAVEMNIDFVRKQFPALAGEWVFCDNAGGSQLLWTVAERIRDYLIFSNAQLGATYSVSRLATERVEEANRVMAELINAPDKCEVILGPSTSMLLRNISFSLVETFKPGDEVIVTNCDHEANIGPWRSMEKKGMVLKEWRINPDTLDLETADLEALLTEKTRLVALTHASNILGTLNPIKTIAALIHEHNPDTMVCVDGVAYAPHGLVDVQDLGVDFYAFSFYKVYGPHYSLLYGKKSRLENLPGINHFFLEDQLPYRFQPGNVNYELSYGLLGIVDYFKEFAALHTGDDGIISVHEAAASFYNRIARHEEKLSTRLLDFLNSKSNVRIIGKKEVGRDTRVPTVSFVVDGMKSSAIPPEVDKHKIGIRFGDFYARRLIEDLGLAPQDGVVRISMVHYNTLEETDRLIKILDTLI